MLLCPALLRPALLRAAQLRPAQPRAVLLRVAWPRAALLPPAKPPLAALLPLLLAGGLPAQAAPPGLASPAASTACLGRAEAPTRAPQVLELYTSEGCSSCPPADRWLAQFTGRQDVLPLAFHVTYWDRLGWPDRYADPLHTQRQKEVRDRLGARQIYTPQTVLDGRDWRGWWQNQALPPASGGPAALSLTLSGQGQAVDVELQHRPGTPLPARLHAYWAVSEDGHSTQVKAGENEGSFLRHAAVVRGYTPIPPPLLAPLHAGQALRLRYTPPPASPGAGARRVVLVVANADTGSTVQAGALACGG